MSLLLLLNVFLAISSVVGKVPEPKKYILSFDGDNPLEIDVLPSPEKNYFILLGDWGCDKSDKIGVKLQKGVAELMKSFVKSQKSKGMNLLFVGTVGDNFYSSGQTCKLWNNAWTEMYGEVATDYPWLGVWGNHDWGGHDPTALCAWGTEDPYIDNKTKIPYAANQLNADKGGCNPKNYWIPDFGYYYAIPELELEWIAMDYNSGAFKKSVPGQKDCGKDSTGAGYLKKIETASREMMSQRAKVSNNSNFMLIQHYAGGQLKSTISDFKKDRKDSGDGDIVWSAGGHTHHQQCMHYDNYACEQIMTGGGGHGEASNRKGFMVIGFDANKKMIQPYAINDTTISCINPCGQDITVKDILESNFYNCCNDPDEAQLCHLHDLEKC